MQKKQSGIIELNIIEILQNLLDIGETNYDRVNMSNPVLEHVRSCSYFKSALEVFRNHVSVFNQDTFDDLVNEYLDELI